MLILSAIGLTQKIMTNKFAAAFCLSALLMLPSLAAAKISKQIPLYDQSKYAVGFSHFDYVNPQAPKGGRIVLPEYGGFDNFNPFIFKGIATAQVANLSLDSLGIVPADDPYTVYPLLAKAFDMPADKSYIGFILDEHAKFHDGSPVTADDVIFSYNALMEKGQPLYKVYYADVDRVEKVNSREVRFYFKKGTHNRELPLILSQMKIYSAKDWEGRDFSKPELRIPLGSGPYKLEKFEPGRFLIFKRDKITGQKTCPAAKVFLTLTKFALIIIKIRPLRCKPCLQGALMSEKNISPKSG